MYQLDEIKQTFVNQGLFVPDNLSRGFVKQLIDKSKRLIKATELKPINQKMFQSVRLCETIVYEKLKQAKNDSIQMYIPDERFKGSLTYSYGVLNTITG